MPFDEIVKQLREEKNSLERQLAQVEAALRGLQEGKRPAPEEIAKPLRAQGKRKLSPEGRKNISRAAKRRWAAFRRAR